MPYCKIGISGTETVKSTKNSEMSRFHYKYTYKTLITRTNRYYVKLFKVNIEVCTD